MPHVGVSTTTRVMVVGDSVTHGLSGDYTWRYFSWQGLQRTGARVDLVGPHRGTYSDEGWFAGDYADPGFDQDHASRYGLSMWETLFFPGGERTPSVAELMTYEPDVIVEALGVNDLMVLNQTPDDLARYVAEFITKARAVNPGVDVVVVPLPQVWIGAAPTYNAYLPALADDMSTVESRIVVAPLAEFTRGVETFDDAHPTVIGMRKIAAAVSAGLEELGIGRAILMPEPGVSEQPGPSTLPVPTPTPTPTPPAPAATAPTVTTAPTPPPFAAAPVPPRHVRAVLAERRTTVTWRRVRRATSYSVRCGQVRRTATGSRAVLRAATRQCAVRARNAGGASSWVRVGVDRGQP
ncbi:SGNH/GDSL hydrolase family protein [Nocardioides baculatus]|uniref:SGNH hydrolase-type esterase domain-containing protein n=1 Tax=Nocardioides baculatus TaxID=2801337 RepID=A0ABS1L967_9ACTN|nr:GDSL-type esterase/lipase family protein [Nocardioides baculatus]MBL0748225.1 hypothetical protein [Nocardioides baculatus]